MNEDSGTPSGPPVMAGSDDVRPPVVILSPLDPNIDAPLSASFRFIKAWDSPSEELLAARALLCTFGPRVDARVLESLPALECVVTPSAGLNHIDLDSCRRRGIAVANAGSVVTEDTADYAVGLLIAVLRGIAAADRYVRGGMWKSSGDYPLGFKLSGKCVGILGLGSIGSAVAKRLEAFGCMISYHSRTRKPSISYHYYSSVVELALHNDVLIVSCSLTNKTHHIVDRIVLEALGKQGVLINIGRGALLDQRELVKCLMEGQIGGAGLDVFENEPDVPSELLQMSNVVLSPHVAALTGETARDVIRVTIENLEAFFSSKPLLYPVLL